MSEICSAHQGYEPGCPRCESEGEAMNHVTQPVAQQLKDAGWEWETEFAYYDGTLVYCAEEGLNIYNEKLPAPSIGELRERLTLQDLRAYSINVENIPDVDWYISWLYTVTASADALAKVWMWVNAKEKGE